MDVLLAYFNLQLAHVFCKCLLHMLLSMQLLYGPLISTWLQTAYFTCLFLRHLSHASILCICPMPLYHAFFTSIFHMHIVIHLSHSLAHAPITCIYHMPLICIYCMHPFITCIYNMHLLHETSHGSTTCIYPPGHASQFQLHLCNFPNPFSSIMEWVW